MSIYDLNAYEVIREEDLSDLKSKGILLKHKKSQAKILLFANDDENKVFTIGFRTPLRTVPEFLILWNIPCCVARKIFR